MEGVLTKVRSRDEELTEGVVKFSPRAVSHRARGRGSGRKGVQ